MGCSCVKRGRGSVEDVVSLHDGDGGYICIFLRAGALWIAESDNGKPPAKAIEVEGLTCVADSCALHLVERASGLKVSITKADVYRVEALAARAGLAVAQLEGLFAATVPHLASVEPHLAVGSLGGQGRLARYFCGDYLVGKEWHDGWDGYKVHQMPEWDTVFLQHQQSGLRVWEHALDLRGAMPCSESWVPLFCYTTAEHFRTAVEPERSTAEVFGRLLRAQDSLQLRCSALEPLQLYDTGGEACDHLVRSRLSTAAQVRLSDHRRKISSQSAPRSSSRPSSRPSARPSMAGGAKAEYCLVLLVTEAAVTDLYRKPAGDMQMLLSCGQQGHFALGKRGERAVQLEDDQLAWDGRSTRAAVLRLRLDFQRVAYGDGHPKTLLSGTALASLLGGIGQGAEAEALLRSIVERRRAALGPRDGQTLTATERLARLLRSLGRPEEAEPLLREVLEARREMANRCNPPLLDRGFSHVSGFRGSGRRSGTHSATVSARLLLWRATSFVRSGTRLASGRATSRPLAAESRREKMKCSAELAEVMACNGRLQEAEDLYREAWELGGGSGVTGDSVVVVESLAAFLNTLGRLQEAEDLYRSVFEWWREHSGEGSPETLNAANALAVVLKREGRDSEAVEILQEALEAGRAEVGDKHQQVIRTLTSLAAMLDAAGDVAAAEELYREAWLTEDDLNGRLHIDTLAAWDRLTALLERSGRQEEAEPMLAEGVAVAAELFGERHPTTLSRRARHAAVLQALGEVQQAEQLLREVLEASREVFGPQHEETAAAASGLAMLLDGSPPPEDVAEAEGVKAEIEALYREVLDIRRSALGTENADTLDAIYTLALFLELQGDLEQAAVLYREALESGVALWGKDHEESKNNASVLALALQAGGKSDEAAQVAAEYGLDLGDPDDWSDFDDEFEEPLDL